MEETLRQIEAHLARQADLRRNLWVSLLIGTARGLGFALGFSVLGAMIAAALREIVLENLSGICGFLAQIVQNVELRM